MKRTTYLDHNATTKIRPEALELLLAAASDSGNASSIHGFGRAARKYVEEARNRISSLLDVGPNQVFFNSGATEGNNTILRGFGEGRILVSSIEHPSVLQSGASADLIPVGPDGVVDVAAFSEQIRKGPSPVLVSVMLVNNETGVIQPVAEISRIAKEAGSLVHCDAVQGFGRIKFTRESLGVDFLTLSSHKIGGPQGVGALVMAPRVPLPRLLMGGGQERSHRAGTENVAGIAAFGLAAQLAVESLPDFAKLSLLRDQIEKAVRCNFVRIHGETAPRVANTTLLTVRGQSSEVLLIGFDLEGVALSGGSACSSGATHSSHVLKAMGVPEEEAGGALRISLGWNSTQKDVDEFVRAWNNLRSRVMKDLDDAPASFRSA